MVETYDWPGQRKRPHPSSTQPLSLQVWWERWILALAPSWWIPTTTNHPRIVGTGGVDDGWWGRSRRPGDLHIIIPFLCDPRGGD
jgi:hypothetical protein